MAEQKAKQQLTVEESGDGFWLITMHVEWPDGQNFSFSIKHKIAAISVSELERSAIAQARQMLGHIVGIADRTH